jgi:hypothetical protein
MPFAHICVICHHKYFYGRAKSRCCTVKCRRKDRVPIRPLSERFWSKVRKTETCWIWTGYCNPSGYGEIQRGRRGEGAERASRISWEIHFGSIPEEMCVLHRCDNPPCVNPEHLFLGTRADNNHDMINKGRRNIPLSSLRRGDNHPHRLHPENVARGEQTYHAKLTADNVRYIRNILSGPYIFGQSAQLSRTFNVSKSVITAVMKRHTWKHIQ